MIENDLDIPDRIMIASISSVEDKFRCSPKFMIAFDPPVRCSPSKSFLHFLEISANMGIQTTSVFSAPICSVWSPILSQRKLPNNGDVSDTPRPNSVPPVLSAR